MRTRQAYSSPIQLRAAAELERRKRQTVDVSLPPFDDWLTTVTPTFSWYWRHLIYTRKELMRVTSGEIKRLMIFEPPRHGKSEMVTIRYPVYRLEQDPAMRVIVGAYNQTLANKFSRKARRIARTRFNLNEERQAVEDWETLQGGGLRAVGVGGGITGQGGDLIIIDDPIKNREEANSETYRNKIYDWYTDDLYTRLEPGGAIILIQTRWHEDDLAGRILASDDSPNWTIINLPAEAEEDDPLGREPGAALCPERYDLTELAKIKVVLGNSWYALYQQRPVAPEGEMFKRHWFAIVDATPQEGKLVRYWDKAGTADGGKMTAGVLMRVHNGIYYIEDCATVQLAAAEREAFIKQTAQLDGDNITIWSEQEPGSGGKESADATIKNLTGFKVYADKVTGDKVTRAEPLAAQAMAGNVRIKKGPWNKFYLDCLTSFPYGTFADPVDASSGAFNKLTGQWKTMGAFIKVG